MQSRLSAALTEPLECLFEASEMDTWASIRSLLKHESEAAASAFSFSVTGFELDQATLDKMVNGLKEYARKLLERKSKEEAGKVMIRMKDRFALSMPPPLCVIFSFNPIPLSFPVQLTFRFAAAFNHDKDSMPRVWTGKEDIRAITREARLEVNSIGMT